MQLTPKSNPTKYNWSWHQSKKKRNTCLISGPIHIKSNLCYLAFMCSLLSKSQQDLLNAKTQSTTNWGSINFDIHGPKTSLVKKFGSWTSITSGIQASPSPLSLFNYNHDKIKVLCKLQHSGNTIANYGTPVRYCFKLPFLYSFFVLF